MSLPADLAKRLNQAAEAVEQAGLPEDLRPSAFRWSLDALSAGVLSEGERAGNSGDGAANRLETASTADGLTLSKIAERLDLFPELVARVFDEEDGQVRLIVKRSMLPEPARKASSMRHIALLVAVGRQAAGIEEYTSYDSIREECRELKVYDGPNFAAEVGKLEFRTRGGRNSKEAKANRHHFDEASDLIRLLTQEA